jgi:hypothetical protein
MARAIEDPGERSFVLAGVAGRQGPAEAEAALAEAFHTARAIEDPWERSRALAGVAGWLGPAEAEAALAEALQAAHDIEDPEQRSEAIAFIRAAGGAGWLGPAEAGAALAEALDATHAIEDPEQRSEAIASIFETKPSSGKEMYSLWLHPDTPLRTQSRREALTDLTRWLPMIRRLGDDATLLAVKDAILEVGARWP